MPFLSTVNYVRLEYCGSRNEFAGERVRDLVIFHVSVFCPGMLKGELLWKEAVGSVPKPPNIFKIQRSR